MYKQAIIVRQDIKMDKGKIAVQVAHASVSVLKKISKTVQQEWEQEGQKKVVLKIADMQALDEIRKKASQLKIPSTLIRDAGLTQLTPGTATALALGPAEEQKINKVIGKLKLL